MYALIKSSTEEQGVDRDHINQQVILFTPFVLAFLTKVNLIKFGRQIFCIRGVNFVIIIGVAIFSFCGLFWYFPLPMLPLQQSAGLLFWRWGRRCPSRRWTLPWTTSPLKATSTPPSTKTTSKPQMNKPESRSQNCLGNIRLCFSAPIKSKVYARLLETFKKCPLLPGVLRMSPLSAYKPCIQDYLSCDLPVSDQCYKSENIKPAFKATWNRCYSSFYLSTLQTSSHLGVAMGILGLSKLVADAAPAAIKENEIKNYFGR